MKWHSPDLTLDITCSKGTYIRSLAYDLGQELGCGAYLSSLIRTRSGPFCIGQSITLAELEQCVQVGALEDILYSADEGLVHFDAFVISSTTTVKIVNGQDLPLPSPGHGVQTARTYNEDGEFLGILKWDEAKNLWHPSKILTGTN